MLKFYVLLVTLQYTVATLSLPQEARKDGGVIDTTTLYSQSQGMDNFNKSYDTADYMNITDKVFLLSFPELKEYVYGRGLEYRGKLTSEAVKISNPEFNANMKEQYWSYFLRTPYPEDNYKVISIDDRGSSYGDATGDSGIRPALYVDSSAKATSGKGSKTSPYIIK